MRVVLQALILAPIAILIVLLSVANRNTVTLSLDPFSGTPPAWALTAPLFAILFVAVMFGVVLGGAAAWLAQAKYRRAARRFRAQATRHQAEAERLKAAQGGARGEATGTALALRT